MPLPTGVSRVGGPGLRGPNVYKADRAPTGNDNKSTGILLGDIWIHQGAVSSIAFINVENEGQATWTALTSDTTNVE